MNESLLTKEDIDDFGLAIGQKLESFERNITLTLLKIHATTIVITLSAYFLCMKYMITPMVVEAVMLAMGK